jgi:hypothetical protein
MIVIISKIFASTIFAEKTKNSPLIALTIVAKPNRRRRRGAQSPRPTKHPSPKCDDASTPFIATTFRPMDRREISPATPRFASLLAALHASRYASVFHRSPSALRRGENRARWPRCVAPSNSKRTFATDSQLIGPQHVAISAHLRCHRVFGRRRNARINVPICFAVLNEKRSARRCGRCKSSC